jgi:hypothetical protein
MTDTIAEGILPWDFPSAYRPGDDDFNGAAMEDDAEDPPDNSFPTAGLFNNLSISAYGVGALVPGLTLSIVFATVPVVDSMQGMRGASPGTTAFSWGSQWIASATYAAGALVVPAVSTGFYYKATTGGTASAGPVTWPTVIGSTVTDGSVVWTCFASSLYLIVVMRTPSGAGAGDVFVYWATGALPPPVCRPKAFLNGATPAFAPAVDRFTDSNLNSGVRVVTKNAAGTATDLPVTIDVM